MRWLRDHCGDTGADKRCFRTFKANRTNQRRLGSCRRSFLICNGNRCGWTNRRRKNRRSRRYGRGRLSWFRQSTWGCTKRLCDSGQRTKTTWFRHRRGREIRHRNIILNWPGGSINTPIGTGGCVSEGRLRNTRVIGIMHSNTFFH